MLDMEFLTLGIPLIYIKKALIALLSYLKVCPTVVTVMVEKDIVVDMVIPAMAVGQGTAIVGAPIVTDRGITNAMEKWLF